MIKREEGVLHPSDFLEKAKFADMSYPYDITDEVKEKIKDFHPSMFIGDRLTMDMYEVKYGYTTTRGNRREGLRIVLLPHEAESDEYMGCIMAEGKFQSWLSSFNILYPFKALSNVEILDIAPLARAVVALG